MRLLKRLGLIAALAVIVVACNVLKYDEVVTNRTIEFKVSTAYDDVLFEASFLDEGTFSKGLRRTGSIPKLIQGIDFNLKNSQDSIVYQAVFVGDTDSIEGAHLWRDSTDYGNKFEFLVKDTNGTVLEEVTFIAKNKFQNCDFYTKGGEPTEAQTIELNLTDDTGKQTYSVRASNNRKLKAVSINDTKEPLVGHRYKFDIKDLNDSIIFLARYFGDNKDSSNPTEVDGNKALLQQFETHLYFPFSFPQEE